MAYYRNAVTAKQGWYIRYIQDFTGELFHGTNKIEAQGFIKVFEKLAHEQEKEITKKLVAYIETKTSTSCDDKGDIEKRRQFIKENGVKVLKNEANKTDELYQTLYKIARRYITDTYELLF